MNKAEMIEELVEKTNFPKKDVTCMYESLIGIMQENLKNEGDSVSLYGIGVINVKKQKGRVGRNPKTGEKLTIPAKKKLSFKVSKTFADSMNK